MRASSQRAHSFSQHRDLEPQVGPRRTYLLDFLAQAEPSPVRKSRMQPRPHILEFWWGRLPPWKVADHLHFVTVHLAGAIPAPATRQIRRMSAQLSKAIPENRVAAAWRIFQALDRRLDRSTGMTYLVNPAVASMVMDAIEHRTSRGIWRVHEYVLMPSHVHLLLDLLSQGLRRSLRSFKRWTSSRVREILDLSPQSLWQTEWFDHWVRTTEEAEGIRRYIQQNPVKAGLVGNYSRWPYGSWSCRA
jgi:REP element-mobilizing transposase RayT